MEKFFHLRENGTDVATELLAGLTTFFAMSYIIFVNPQMLAQTGMPYQAVFLATLFSAGISTICMGLIANVPYALAPGMGLNAFFTYTVCFSLGFSWKEALAMVFICGLFNIFITVTRYRKQIIKSIPPGLQHAISGGIGIFIAYIGIKNAGFIEFTSGKGSILSINGSAYNTATENFAGGVYSVVSNGGIVPAITNFTNSSTLLALFGLILTVVLLIKNVRGAILIGIVATTIANLFRDPAVVSAISFDNSIGQAFADLGTTFGAAMGKDGLISLFSNPERIPLVLMTIFAFSLSDVFDTIGTFVGTGRRTGIFSDEDEEALEKGSGFSSKMDKALFADAIGTSIGAILGTSNTTTYVESAAGIGAGGRTGLTSIVTGVLFFLCMFLAPVIGIVPAAATAPALIVVGILMLSSFKEIDWSDLEEAIPAFFSSVLMSFVYSISYGIAGGFIFYCIVKVVKGKAKEISPILWISTALFVLNFIIMAYI